MQPLLLQAEAVRCPRPKAKSYMWEFPKIRGALFGVLIIRILRFRVLDVTFDSGRFRLVSRLTSRMFADVCSFFGLHALRTCKPRKVNLVVVVCVRPSSEYGKDDRCYAPNPKLP